ncbi:uroporphyrinogen-III C-methyltransferase [Azospirillum doebereinerae]
MTHGLVYLVGAGPGDPDLLTVKAHRLLRSAGTVVYDRLVGADILRLIPRSAERIFVGKAPKRHTLPQEEISRLLVDLALSGRNVVRLKGGDPFIFGRGSEEALALVEHNVPFEIVPGVTAATGCGAYAGIPLTHRGLATGVRFVTGHGKDDGQLDHDWAGMADPNTTLVLYMALANLAEISARLIAAGMDPDMPAAVVAAGTSARQTRLIATLATLPERAAATELPVPCLVIVGRVVALAPQLSWFQPGAAAEEPPVRGRVRA